MTKHRTVVGLKWAELSSDPWGRGNLQGLRAAGKAFERKALGELERSFPVVKNPWFEFSDQNGGGMASPDGVIKLLEKVLVVECKLTWTYDAHSQLQQLYFPILEKFFDLPCKGIVVCKNLARGVPKKLIKESFNAAALADEPVNVVQWLGVGKL